MPCLDCPNNCNGLGTCDVTTGTCDCHSGYQGADCSTPESKTIRYLFDLSADLALCQRKQECDLRPFGTPCSHHDDISTVMTSAGRLLHVSACMDDMCENGGVCYSDMGRYHFCICPVDFTGAYCQTRNKSSHPAAA